MLLLKNVCSKNFIFRKIWGPKIWIKNMFCLQILGQRRYLHKNNKWLNKILDPKRSLGKFCFRISTIVLVQIICRSDKICRLSIHCLDRWTVLLNNNAYFGIPKLAGAFPLDEVWQLWGKFMRFNDYNIV